MNETSRRILRANLLYLIPSIGFIAASVFLAMILGDRFYQVYTDNMYLVTFLMHLCFLILPAGLYILLHRELWARFRWKPIALWAPFLAMLGFFMLAGVNLLWNYVLTSLGLGQAENAIPTPTNGAELALSFIVISLMPGVTEELFFRGTMLPLYEGRSKKLAIILSGVLFGLLHGQPYGLIAQVFLGLLLGWLVVTTGSIWTGTLYHLTHNAISVAILYGSNRMLESQGTNMEELMAQMQGMEWGEMFPVIQAISIGVIATLAGVAFFTVAWMIWRLCRARNLREGGDGKLYAAPIAHERVSPAAYLPLALAAVVIVVEYGSEVLRLLGVLGV